MGINHEEENSILGKTAPGPAPALVSGGDLSPGYVVGEYRVEQVIGRGGMGVVYSGVQPVIGKRVAIKVLNAQLSADPGLVRRFLDEARAVNRIRHPNIIDIFSFGQLADSRQYFVMEFLEGRTFADRLQAGDLSQTELPPLLGQICDALDAAHSESIVHRDLKPENIWIVEQRRGRPFVKLLDFGIAKLLATGEQSTTQAGVLMGTPQYMSPEQCYGRAIDHRTDIYALGVILYQIYTGKLPFEGETFAELLTKQLTQTPELPSTHANLPQALDALIMRCLSKEPAERPQGARELGEELLAILVPRPIATVPAVAEIRTTTTLRGSAKESEHEAPAVQRTRRWPAIAALVAAGLVIGLGAAYLVQPRKVLVPAMRAFAPPKAPAPIPPETVVPEQPAVVTEVAEIRGVPMPVVETNKEATRPDGKRQRTRPGGHVPSPLPANRPAHERAAGSGLVTDNPFR